MLGMEQRRWCAPCQVHPVCRVQFALRKGASWVMGLMQLFLHITCRLVNLLAAERAMDTVVWQMLASVAIPGYTIHTVVAIAHSVLTQVLHLLWLVHISLCLSPSFDLAALTWGHRVTLSDGEVC